MRMEVLPWPEVKDALFDKLGYKPGTEYDLDGDAIEGMVLAGFDVQVLNVKGGGCRVHVAPGGRGFGQRG